jgi:hypothetical protein
MSIIEYEIVTELQSTFMPSTVVSNTTHLQSTTGIYRVNIDLLLDRVSDTNPVKSSEQTVSWKILAIGM